MIFEISKEAILKVMIGQISSLLSITDDEIDNLNNLSDAVFDRCDICFSKNGNKYYSHNGKTYLNPFHSGQYNVFLYFFLNTIFNNAKNQIRLADKVYYLNKIMNSCDLFYEKELPLCFALAQPNGSVLERAKYGNYFYFTQNCTVGSHKNIFPTFGENVGMAANSLVFGHSPNFIIKKRNQINKMWK